MTFSRIGMAGLALWLAWAAPLAAAPRPGASPRVDFAGIPAPSSLLEGKVVGIQDGDTITLLDASNGSFRIRLLGIDAPEKNQPFGKVAKQVLSDRVFGQRIQVATRGRDRYGRTLGKLLLQGKDINLEMLRQGLVWFYAHYAGTQFPGDAARYAEAEAKARKERTGLWAYPDPMAPWAWRKSRRK